MRYVIIFIAIAIVQTGLGRETFGQFGIELPKIPKVVKKNPETGKAGRINTTETTKYSGGKGIYGPQRPTGTPVFLKNSLYIQATTHNEYWKMPGQRNYSSWVPKLEFNHFYNNEKQLSYIVEYFNPDGSPWYSEKLEQSSRHASDRTVSFKSPSPYAGVLDTKSTAGTGLYSFRITDQDTKQFLFQGKFKVGKFSTANGSPDKNKAEFFVDQDWLTPFGVIGFHHSLDEVGGMMPEVSVWVKGPATPDEFEGRIIYKGQQIASTKDPRTESGVSDYDERSTGMAAAFAPLNYWKRWQFQWGNFRFENSGTFNRDYYPNAHYVDKNPGDYTVKIYRGGTQIRELAFSIAADGRFVVPAYTDQIFMPYHRIVLPAKVLGTAEKWNAAAWKTDAFYGNPLAGFTVQ